MKSWNWEDQNWLLIVTLVLILVKVSGVDPMLSWWVVLTAVWVPLLLAALVLIAAVILVLCCVATDLLQR